MAHFHTVAKIDQIELKTDGCGCYELYLKGERVAELWGLQVQDLALALQRGSIGYDWSFGITVPPLPPTRVR